MKKPTQLEIDIMLGLDDIAHNRMYETTDDQLVPVRNYGKRNYDEKCYCELLKKLGVKR